MPRCWPSLQQWKPLDRFGPAALLLWWLIAIGLCLVYLLDAEADGIPLPVAQQLIVSAILGSLIAALSCGGLWLLCMPGHDSALCEMVTVAGMLCLIRFHEGIFTFLRVAMNADIQPDWLLSRLFLKGPFPLLYVLLVCELPSRPRDAAVVAVLYVLDSFLAEVYVDHNSSHKISGSQNLPERADSWIDAGMLLGLSGVSVIRRHCIKSVSAADSFLSDHERQRFGAVTLILWW